MSGEVQQGASVRAVVVDCPEGCGQSFTLPAEVVSSEPASRGQVVCTVRVSPSPDDPYFGHMMRHFTMLDEDEP